MQKLSQKALQQINEINKNMSAVRQKYNADIIAANQKYDKYFNSKDKKTDLGIDAETERQIEIYDLQFKFMRRVKRNLARKAAIMLIDYKIARPNKVLHEGTVLSKTSNLGANGKFIQKQMYDSYYDRDIPGQFADLHEILENEYNVLLLDYNLYRMTLNAIDFPTTDQESLSEYERVLSMFRPGIMKRVIQEHRLQQIKTH